MAEISANAGFWSAYILNYHIITQVVRVEVELGQRKRAVGQRAALRWHEDGLAAGVQSGDLPGAGAGHWDREPARDLLPQGVPRRQHELIPPTGGSTDRDVKAVRPAAVAVAVLPVGSSAPTPEELGHGCGHPLLDLGALPQTVIARGTFVVS
jgi:hypothetical protein